MTSTTIKRIDLPRTDPRLARTIVHDERSKDYPLVPPAGFVRTSVRHASKRRVMNQGQLGSCTAHAGVKCLTTKPHWGASKPVFPKGFGHLEGYTKSWYHDETVVDDYKGTWPPVDTGSSGLACGQVALNRGLIKGYSHTFDLDGALDAVSLYGAIIGITWTNGMYSPNADGFLVPSGKVAGGHELDLDEINVEQGYVEGPNSWGSDWGPLEGRFRLSFEVFGDLLADNGDSTVFIPLDA